MPVLDVILPILIIAGLILAIWAKASGQTIGDLFRDMADFFSDKKEETQETMMGVYGR